LAGDRTHKLIEDASHKHDAANACQLPAPQEQEVTQNVFVGSQIPSSIVQTSELNFSTNGIPFIKEHMQNIIDNALHFFAALKS
jgi:hypothetical protein